MCGIAGIHYKHDVDPAVLGRAEAHFGRSLAHRGPDHFGIHRAPRSVFVNLRLAIVDRASGQQPIYSPGGKQGIVYNGEVYNHQALRSEQSAYPFSTHSDTEVLLATWAARGPHAFASWNGMFAACLFTREIDGRIADFTLVRDRFGAKPLYIYEDEHCVAFASELRTLLGLPGLDLSLNPVGFQDYLSYRYNLAPHTQFKRIEKLPAGCFAQWKGEARRDTVRYTEVTVPEAAAGGPVDQEALIQELDGLLAKAVHSQLMGEVPIGVLLSGGLDSSTIAAYVQRAGARLKAYSVGLREVNEFPFSRAVAEQFGLDYVEICMSTDELRTGMDRVIGLLDEPIADPACFALSKLCERIKQDVTVVLSGEGGDEMFAGYDQHQVVLDPKIAPDKLFTHFFVLSSNDLKPNELLRDKAMPLHHLRYRPYYDNAPSPLAGMQAFELNSWMPENLMMKADKVLMAHSLEGRFPFLDVDLYRFASTLPAAMKLPAVNSSKHLLRQLMARQLPRSVVQRQKMGFTVPPMYMLAPMQSRLVEAIEQLRGTPVADVLDLDAISAMFERYFAGDARIFLRVWNVAVLLLWWVDVYPKVLPQPEPLTAAEPVAAPKRKLTVYTALIGQKEQLSDPLAQLPAGAASDLDIDWVCITDNPSLTSPTWRLQLIDEPHLPPEKLSRRPKAMPHLYFPDTECSLYVDNTVTFHRLPQASDLQHGGEYLFRAFKHGTRHNPDEEAAVVATIGYDDVATVAAQMDFYAKRRSLASITPLTTATVILRSHHHPVLQRFGQLWWESILAFSKRDQLSFDFARIESGAQLDWWPGSTDANPFIHWHGGIGKPRVQANFDAKRYAWLHRDDPEALQDPRGHYLQHGRPHDPTYVREMPVMEYACWRQNSSLGTQVSPRRGMAQALESLLSGLTPGQRFLIVRVQDSRAERAFSPQEFDSATKALSILLGTAKLGQGTVLDLDAAAFTPDGKVFSTGSAPYGLVLLLGLPGEQIGIAARKLQRLLDPQQGRFIAALTSPAPLQTAAATEAWMAETFAAATRAELHASRHDDLRQSLPNTVIGISWQQAAVPQIEPAAAPLEAAS